MDKVYYTDHDDAIDHHKLPFNFEFGIICWLFQQSHGRNYRKFLENNYKKKLCGLIWILLDHFKASLGKFINILALKFKNP